MAVAILVAALVPALTNKSSAASDETPFVKYRAVWAVSIEQRTSIPNMNNVLEVSCQNGGVLKAEPIHSWIDGTSPTCDAVGVSALKCTQVVQSTIEDNWAVNATLVFQCHGNDVIQLVGQATAMDQNITFTSDSPDVAGTGESAGQGAELYVFDVILGETLMDSECSVELLNVPQYDGYRCAVDGRCEANSVSSNNTTSMRQVLGCEIYLAKVSNVQSSPLKLSYMQ
ncbi:hypothetical protein MHU86_15664 [Fragilaria crotonensis]|nr:hypothetical protein MHU86_15664 [Fragilaria crotonensis]